MNDLSWLAEVCDPEKRDRPAAVAAHPWRLILDGGPWACATDGRALVAVRGPCDLPDMPEKYAGPSAEFLAMPGARHELQADAAALRAWAGPAEVPREVPCRECLGSGTTVCGECDRERTCPECRGKAKVWETPDLRPGRLAGRPVNRALLAVPLSHLDGPCRVYVTAAGEKKDVPAVLLVGDGWRVVTTCLGDGAVGEGDDCPALGEPAPAGA